jgi:hypothetical protein
LKCRFIDLTANEESIFGKAEARLTIPGQAVKLIQIETAPFAGKVTERHGK